MIHIVLDDDIISTQQKGALPIGRNRSEEIYERLDRLKLDAILYDGRAGDFRTILRRPADAAEELVRRIQAKYGVMGSALQFDCRICLDLKWFENMNYGTELLRILYAHSGLNIDRVVVLSLYTDAQFAKDFEKEFQIPEGNMLVRGAVDWDYVVRAMTAK